MQTHENNSHGSFIAELQRRAEIAEKAKASTITAGDEGEQAICKWKASNGVHGKRLPDDPQGILRISVGGGDHLPVTMNYVVVRGSVGQCIELLEKALVALRECPE